MDFSAFSLSPSKGLRLIDSLAHPYVFIRVRPRAWIRMQSGRHFHKRMYLACSFARQPGRKNVDAIKSLGEEGCTIVSRWMAAIMFRSRPVINRKIISPDYKFFSIFWYGFKWRIFFFLWRASFIIIVTGYVVWNKERGFFFRSIREMIDVERKGSVLKLISELNFLFANKDWISNMGLYEYFIFDWF